MVEEFNQSDTAADRRTSRRSCVAGRSAVWFDLGPVQGMLGAILNLSMSGFSVRLLAPPLVPREGEVVHCVLLIQQAHFDCLAKVVSAIHTEEGDVQAGFCFEALSESNQRLLSGVLRFLAQQQGQEE